ncbi:uncharacterized protein EURHEDRAFT_30129 [Aspergillus ruber CBS 135680]|uniref:Uncharacterized protein n=1 Tax=Aspergillus ruber (strain CBS 135680) TaxID=1388766 RepID=A0A017SS45_ASPRC|nr:uncharacterized protein EURHEDRAFT_30129 [Aspergillus ruber CBS 135680]EYE99803.1 hypothetical protein EURHEDRAFT_30129 [Aspergillus ruber CBS 135680]
MMMTAGRTYLRYPLGNGGTKEKKKNTDTRIEFFLSREWKSRKSREGEREEEGEKKRGMSRPEWGGEQTDSGTQKDPRDHRNARMHPPHTDTRAARSALERSHEDSHRDDYVLCIIFVIVVLVIMQEGGRVLNLYEPT